MLQDTAEWAKHLRGENVASDFTEKTVTDFVLKAQVAYQNMSCCLGRKRVENLDDQRIRRVSGKCDQERVRRNFSSSGMGVHESDQQR